MSAEWIRPIRLAVPGLRVCGTVRRASGRRLAIRQSVLQGERMLADVQQWSHQLAATQKTPAQPSTAGSVASYSRAATASRCPGPPSGPELSGALAAQTSGPDAKGSPPPSP